MIIWVASYPRSGNNLCLLQTLRAVFRVTTGALQNLHPLLSSLSLEPDGDPLAALREHEETIFLKTHRVADAEDPNPAIYLVRDGRDSVVSYAHFAKAQGEGNFGRMSYEEAIAALIERQDHPYGNWSAHVRAWTGRDAPTEIIRFEELVADPVGTVRNAVEALGVSLPEPSRAPPSFEALHERDPDRYRRGKVGSWKTELSPDLEELFWRKHGATMVALGYSRE
jgi:hypothetical protein